MDVISGFLITAFIVAVIHRAITGHWLGEGKGKGKGKTRKRVTHGRWRVVRRRTVTRRRTVRGRR